MSNERKNLFNYHLNRCSNCAVEIEDISDVRFSIHDWKSSKFDNLLTPKIHIPYETAPIKIIETMRAESWFDLVKNYLTQSPVVSGAMAALILALLLSVGVFIFSINDGQMIALSNTNPNVIVKPSVTIQNSAELKNVKVAENQEISDKNNQSDKNINQTEDNIIDNNISAKVLEKTTNSKQKTQILKTIERKQNLPDTLNVGKNTKVAPKTKKPRLNELPEEDEDNTLRLADLFAELDTKK
ncbi:MAG: hypothetical protein ABIP06_12520 [Pyrinomonadaceae bacterium]